MTSITKLAIDGGKRLIESPLPPWPVFDEGDREAVNDMLASGKVNYWTGSECRRFEAEFAEWVGCEYGIAVANGTLALELALLAGGIQTGDEVVVTPRSFIASTSCVVSRGAIPIMADVDENTGNLTRASIERVITPKTRAVIPVHVGGIPCAMPEIMSLAEERNLVVVEDCAQSHGASIGARLTGSFGHVNAFSFCQDKIMSTGGEGGMVVTNSRELWQKAWSYKDHGKNYEKTMHSPAPPGFRWLHDDFGTNWRMTEFQGVLGRRQLKKVDAWVERRRENAGILDSAFAGMGIFHRWAIPHEYNSSYYRYYVSIEPHRLKADWNRERIIRAIEAEGAPCFVGSCCEIYKEQAYEPFRKNQLRMENAARLSEVSLAFLTHPTIRPHEQKLVAAAAEKVMAAALR